MDFLKFLFGGGSNAGSGPEYPYSNLRFSVEIDGLTWAGFSEVTGLSIEIDVEEYLEGGVNEFVHKLPKTVKFQNITLKKGLIQSYKMWDWIQEVAEGSISPQNCRIILMDQDGNTICYWAVANAFPVKWTGSDLKATGGEIFMESLELAHQGIQRY